MHVTSSVDTFNWLSTFLVPQFQTTLFVNSLVLASSCATTKQVWKFIDVFLKFIDVFLKLLISYCLLR